MPPSVALDTLAACPATYTRSLCTVVVMLPYFQFGTAPERARMAKEDKAEGKQTVR